MSRRAAGKTNFGRKQAGGHSMNPDRANKADTSHPSFRTRATVNRLKMYKSGGKAIRARNGEIIKAAPFQSWTPSGTVARVEPNRRWFGNTRVIGQKELQGFREAMVGLKQDPYQFVIKQNKLPMSLITDPVKSAHNNLLTSESFKDAFGRKSKRKRPNLAGFASIDEMVKQAEDKESKYDPTKDKDLVDKGGDDIRDWSGFGTSIFTKGQSKRIWSELYKVIDASDIVVQVLDARDPEGTRCKHIEAFMKNEKSFKQLVFVLNKCDLVPNWSTSRWVAHLSKSYPTLAFHASITNAFGKGALIELLRQFGKLHSDKQQISVGFIGYPNVGKSSVINTLRAEKVCKTAPIPGETKVWQYVTLMRKIYLIDCPGVVYNVGDSEAEMVLKGIVRIEKLETPEDYIPELLKRTKPEYVERTYGIPVGDASDHMQFLERLAIKLGRLHKKAEADIRTVALMVLHDWQMGKLPYFSRPPISPDHDPNATYDKLKEKLGVEQNLDDLPSAKTDFFDSADLQEPEQNTKVSGDNINSAEDTEDNEDVENSAGELPSESTEYLSWEALVNGNEDDEQNEVKNSVDSSTVVSEKVPTQEEASADTLDKKKSKGTVKKKSNKKSQKSKSETSDGNISKQKAKKLKKSKKDVKMEEEVDEGKYKKQVKAPRMTTNKGKTGSNYYNEVNVKNRKRRKPTKA